MAQREVVGVVSLIIWALLIVVTAKYVLFLMQADNKGEGGILSLTALAQTAFGRRTTAVFLLGVAGSALFSGDAMITPAISVLSALEGLKQVDAELAPFRAAGDRRDSHSAFCRPEQRGTAGVAVVLRADHGDVFFLVNALLGLGAHPSIGLGHFAPSKPRFPGLEFLFHRAWRNRLHRARQRPFSR